jgi:undecaprenyl diphosphate synthase
MSLFVQYLEKEMGALAAAGVRLKVIGDVCAFAPDLQVRIHAAEKATQQNQLITLVLAANYGGQWDVVQAVNKWQLANSDASASTLSQAQLAKYLSTSGMPDVDLLIRTGGEQRISNFMLWQLAYSELYFTELLWPEFTETELSNALHWFATRERRFGKVIHTHPQT